VAAMKWHTIDTKRGVKCRVLEGGGGAPLVYFHGAGGLLKDNPFLDALAQRHSIFAPEWPGYGESSGDELLEDMLDFALHGWDVIDALGLTKPNILGHSMGGMIAAEMACLAPRDLGKLVLASPAGLWIDAHPIPDVFAMLPFEIANIMFADPQKGQSMMTGGADLSDIEALKDYYIASQRRLAMAGKILFPIPNRRLSKRLYRLTAETLIVWGAADRLIIPAYAKRWQSLIPKARVEMIDGAGHMLPYEQPDAFVAAVQKFLA
jgi:pimeloyl-ACP methyl ester carboxylesterase